MTTLVDGDNVMIPTGYKIVRVIDGTWTATLTNDMMKFAKDEGYTFVGFLVNNYNRRELLGQPRFKELVGPMYDGDKGGVAIVRYECPIAYETLSS